MGAGQRWQKHPDVSTDAEIILGRSSSDNMSVVHKKVIADEMRGWSVSRKDKAGSDLSETVRKGSARPHCL